MDGILIIDKPAGITSHDVVAGVRRILKTRRIGHTGTLDPFATGVLVLLIGKATRLAQFLENDVKEYDAVLRFGFETDTSDKTGLRTADCELPNDELVKLLSKTNWEEILMQYRGEIEQIPPMYSAKKIKGQKLYDLARKGKVVERDSQKVTIHKLEVLEISNRQSAIRIQVVCSAGTYIRTLAEHIGRKLGVGAHLEDLRRIRSGKFALDQSVTLEELEQLDNPSEKLFPTRDAVSRLPVVIFSEERIEKTRTGLATKLTDAVFADNQPVQILDKGQNLIAVGFYNKAEGNVKPRIVLA